MQNHFNVIWYQNHFVTRKLSQYNSISYISSKMKHMPVFYCDCVKSFYEQRFSIVIIICKLVPTFEGYGHVGHYLCDLNKILLIIAQECRPGWAYRLFNRWFIGTQRLPVFCLRILIFWVLFIIASFVCTGYWAKQRLQILHIRPSGMTILQFGV